ncbi:uncharacterized protein LY79DRAFT_518018 [Colletotrichum navitas]|uniref:DUF7872 domain-containing protein n=1 Tax=Colletotrichum navitas TaxID=681940 RepID=A0AAD8PY25_9PEZI|nr:uncharacterized protein LY79DRAFT_518018 [Colletotrichum navitas]KAK1585858.1 hypothetical protein LY79DRAFT_518018 [Colletotrichum navitas]
MIHAVATPLSIPNSDDTTASIPNSDGITVSRPNSDGITALQPTSFSCPIKELSSETWIEENVDDFLAVASQNYIQYPNNNIQALAAYLGSPNFYCGVNQYCNAGQPCAPAQLPGWYALMAIQQWNAYVNNLHLAVTYTVAILSMKLPTLVNTLWPKPKDTATKAKIALAWINGIINAFPVTATFGAVTGSIGAAIQGNNIITSSMLQPPAPDQQYLKWSAIADQLSTQLNDYKGAIGQYAKTIIDAPINDTRFGVNSVLHGGKYLTRGRNFTQDDIEKWMYGTVSVNAMGLLLQAQNVYIIRTFNLSSCSLGKYYTSAFFCQQQPNNLWTRYRLQKRGSLDPVPEHRIASTLQETYNLTKEDIFLGPTKCFDTHNYEQLYNPWETPLASGVLLDPLAPCNFNVNVCNMDAADDDMYGPTDYTEYDNKSDWWCELQGVTWT